ncbi:F420-0:Gamma-glutamyl ligase [Planktothrix mougeotii]|uniref:F420-0:Gamma-glutamyl ligase n=1 Tax=Planktothrix mougeotii LEGE 06226 TaxID=1828728 RepID=A0ABR9UJZ4_9CYAN|nr:F420-0:Gamma-glutamyl ligase [Planktothrix mougeotii]MBE9146793.1 F420-0:Gamma-glutamyl ligase [Planktothrix mougeotii LEGE 06226]
MAAGLSLVTTAAFVLLGLGTLALEIQYRLRPGNKLELTQGEWNLDLSDSTHYVLRGEMEFRNLTPNLEIMLPEVTAQLNLLSKASLDGIKHTIKVIPAHLDAPSREDNYWFGYIVKVKKTTRIKVLVEIEGQDLSALQSAWVTVNYITYGPEGRIPKVRHVVLPLKYPDPTLAPNKRIIEGIAEVYPIRTHLLTHIDHPVEVIKKYVLPHAQPGDIVTLGETPVALMQGRFFHPTQIKPGWVAKRVCYFFMPTSSLATACGMQTLVDVVGPARVLFAIVVGTVAKLLGKPGVFYQLAGEQARLIDDVTGTLPPYDQFIVLGPDDPQNVVNTLQQETGLGAAIVDVNDLKAVKILAASPGLSTALIQKALRSNPAGNADEQTPLVLIRPL